MLLNVVLGHDFGRPFFVHKVIDVQPLLVQKCLNLRIMNCFTITCLILKIFYCPVHLIPFRLGWQEPHLLFLVLLLESTKVLLRVPSITTITNRCHIFIILMLKEKISCLFKIDRPLGIMKQSALTSWEVAHLNWADLTLHSSTFHEFVNRLRSPSTIPPLVVVPSIRIGANNCIMVVVVRQRWAHLL